MNPPWMPLYIADYLKDTTHLQAMESGAYLHLIMAYWSAGRLPNDDRQLAAIARMAPAQWKKSRPTLEAFFGAGFSSHKRIDRELAHAADVIAKRKSAAEQRHSKRHANADANAPPNADPNVVHLDTQSPSQKERKKETAADAASSSALGNGHYAFQEGVIRLTAKDFSKWKEAFERLDLAAELIALAPWAAEQRDWFCAVSAALAKKNREAKARIEAVRAGPAKPSGYIEGII